jgi:nucleotide-binding universal stress UspA family protein
MAKVMQTIVVAYDDPGSETLERAAELAQALGSTLIVTNVAAAAEGTEVDPAEREASGKLDDAKRVLETQGVAAEYAVARGHPGEAIARLAAERNADLIVVGTRRKGFFDRLVEGSVLQEVLRRAQCDVLVVS